MLDEGLNQTGYVTDTVTDVLYPAQMAVAADALRRFADLIRGTRESLGWTQDELAEASGVSRPTINRYETGKTGTPDPDTVRKIFLAMRLDPRRIPVILGYVTAEEMGLPADEPRVFDASVEEVIRILQDPNVDRATKAEWVEYLRFRAQRAQDAPKGRRRAM
jgi:transcriptional regulator with XRE-family HTH domain